MNNNIANGAQSASALIFNTLPNPGVGATSNNKRSAEDAISTTNDNMNNGSRPTKMPKNQEGRFSSGLGIPKKSSPSDRILETCMPIVKKLIGHEYGWVFKDAVDPVELGIPDYFDIVKKPMDLTLVVNKLEGGVYDDISSFEEDTKLVFENAILFNGSDSDVGVMAQELLNIFAQDLKNVGVVGV